MPSYSDQMDSIQSQVIHQAIGSWLFFIIVCWPIDSWMNGKSATCILLKREESEHQAGTPKLLIDEHYPIYENGF